MVKIMKILKLVVICILVVALLSGCGLFSLTGLMISGDLEFTKLINKLNTPQKVCSYMENNFSYFCDPNKPILTPYELYLIKVGDCDDFSNFASFAVNHHNYTSYQIYIYFKGAFIYHALAVYLENNKYTYSSNQDYFPIYASTFNDVVLDYFKYNERELNYYKIYDYENNLIEEG